MNSFYDPVICVICSHTIQPYPMYFTKDGQPRHMLCEEKEDEGRYDKRRT